MRNRRDLALLTAGLVASALTVVPAPSRAADETMCVGRAETFELTPGVSMQPSTGSGVTVVSGTEECTGLVEGHRPTGPIRTRHEFTYGVRDPDTCREMDVKGWSDHTIPTAKGTVVLRNHFTAIIDPLADPAQAGTFEGDRSSGRAWVRTVEGDCLNSPLTKVEVGWVGPWHGKR